MTQREKLLAAVVGLLFLVIGAFYAVSRVSAAHSLRENKRLNLDAELRKQQRVVRFGRAAQSELDGYVERSLPADRPLAQSLYQNWLAARATQAGFSGVKVIPMSPRTHGDLYWQHGFMVSGTGDLKQLIQFLHEFYSVDYLHRIERLSAKPLKDTKTLDLHISVNALSMNKAENERLDPRPADRLKYKEVEPYVEKIAHRNFFAPANKPPEFAGPGTQQGNPNRLVTFQPRVKDPDGDELSYRLAGDAPDEASIDPNSGEFRWTPSELGEYEFDVCVTDKGLPPKSVTQTIKISIVQPPPEAPRAGFDPATQAFVTGITEASGSRIVWVTVRTENKGLQLKVGDRLSVGTIQAVVQHIRLRPKEVRFATDDGRVVTVRLGQSLVPEGAAPISGI